jgi:hypothetical protein
MLRLRIKPFTGLVSLSQFLYLCKRQGVLLTEASWNIRKSTAGLSLTLFWPSKSAVAPSIKSSGKRGKSKKRLMRRLKRKGKPEVVIDKTTEADFEIQPAIIISMRTGCSTKCFSSLNRLR